MPASPSRNRDLKPAPKKRLIWPIVLLAGVAIAAVVLMLLPASLITRFLPPQIQAEDFSGSIWHGSSGHITVISRSAGARSAGALEWRLQPLALLTLRVAGNVRWVKGASVIDGDISVDRHGFTASNVRGGGPLDDVHDFGVAAGWSGNTQLDIQELKGSFENLESAAGSLTVSNLASTSIAHAAALGGYVLTLNPAAANADTWVATLKDTGGPLEVLADIRYMPGSHSGSLSGAVKERDSASPALREELTRLAQMKPRDGSGRIPIELEFSM